MRVYEMGEDTCAGAVLRRLRERLLGGMAIEDHGYETPCWIARPMAGRYATFSVLGRSVLMHRASYELFVGPIPGGLHLDHLCRVEFCIRPEHLEAVPPVVNTHRSDNPAGVNARKTHCIRGHEFTPANTAVTTKGERQCRTCVNWRARERRRRRRVGI